MKYFIICILLISSFSFNVFSKTDEINPDIVFVLMSSNPDGCKIIRLSSMTKDIKNLTEEFFSAMDPDVSFDGKKILFTAKKSKKDKWQIWEMGIDGKDKRQLTFGQKNSVSPLYTGTIFNLNDKSPTRRFAYIENNNKEYAIYTADMDGKKQKRISYNLSRITDIDVFKNGRIIYNSIEQFKKVSLRKKSDLFAINIDGTDNMGYLTNNIIKSEKSMLKVSADRRVYFIEKKIDNFPGGGRLSYILEKRPLHSYKVLNPKDRGYFHSPFPSPNGNLMVSYKQNINDLYSLYYLDQTIGKKKLIYKSDKFNCLDAQYIRSRPIVRGRATFVSYKQKTGVFYCISSHISQEKKIINLPPGAIKRVKIFEGFYSKSSNLIESRLLGEAPVEKDGSFHIEVPSEIPLSFQLFGKNGESLSKQYSWTWVMPRESRGCIGCHEDRELAPPNHLSDAITKPAIKIPAYKIKRKK